MINNQFYLRIQLKSALTDEEEAYIEEHIKIACLGLQLHFKEKIIVIEPDKHKKPPSQ